MEEKQNIFWDSYGLYRPESGIFSHAKLLHQELVALGVIPKIIVPDITSFDKRNFPCVEVAMSQLCSQGLKLKLFYSSLVFSSLSKGYAVQGPIVYHGLSNINLPVLSKKKSNVSFVITIHDVIPLLEPRSVSKLYYLQFRYLFSKILEQADYIICVSQWTKEKVLEFLPGKEKNIVVISNGFDLKQRELPLLVKDNTEPIKLLFVSRFEKYKNFDFLLKIIGKAKEKFRLTVVTNNLGVKFLREKIKVEPKLNIEISCLLTQKELQTLYLKSDVYIHTSKYEGFCLPASEALSLGKPVVYLRGSGLDEVVGESVGIGLTALSSVDDWVQAVEEANLLGKSPVFFKKIEDFFKTKITWQEVAFLTKQIYKKLS